MKKPDKQMKASWFAVGLLWFPLFAIFEVVVLVAAVALIHDTFFRSPDASPARFGDPGEAPAEVAPFIPADWRVLQHVATDMDRDGSGDFALLLGPAHAGLGATDKTPLLDRCRNLLLLYGKEGGYERAQYLPWRLRVIIDPDDDEKQMSPCPFSSEEQREQDDAFYPGEDGALILAYPYEASTEFGVSATFRPRERCLELIETSSYTGSHGSRTGEGTDLTTNFVKRQIIRTTDHYSSDDPEQKGCSPCYSRSVEHFSQPKVICAAELTAIFQGSRDPGWNKDLPLHPIIQSAIGPTIPYADVDGPFLPKAPKARKECATPPAATFARTAQSALPLRIRQPQTLAEPIGVPAATTVFALGQTVLEGTERCSYQAATLWAEDDCGLWVRFTHATDCPYDVKREGPLDNKYGNDWSDSHPLEWSGAMGRYFALPREQDGSYLLSRLPSISNACDGPCKNELLPIRFKRVGRGRFVATEVRAEDVPPPEQEGLW